MPELTTYNSKNVSAGKPAVAGAIYYAPSGTALPTDAETDMKSLTNFKSLGYISENGVVNTNTPETDSKKAWGGDTVLTYQTGKDDIFKFTLIETLKEDVLKFVYGSKNVSGASNTAPMTIKVNAKEAEPYVVVIDMLLANDTPKRICIPNAKLTDLGDITYVDEDAIGYECTITCTSDTDGQTHYEYIGN